MAEARAPLQPVLAGNGVPPRRMTECQELVQTVVAGTHLGKPLGASTTQRHTIQLPVPESVAVAYPVNTTIIRPQSVVAAPSKITIVKRSALRVRAGGVTTVPRQQQTQRKNSAPPVLAQMRRSSKPMVGRVQRENCVGTPLTSFNFKPPERHVQFGKHYSIGSQEDTQGKFITQVLAAKRKKEIERWREEQRQCGVDFETNSNEDGDDPAPPDRRVSSNLEDSDSDSVEEVPRGRARSSTLSSSADFGGSLDQDSADSSDEPPEQRCRRPRARSEPIFDFDE